MFGCLFTLLNSDLKIWSAWFRYFICVLTQYKKPQGSISFNKKAHFFWLTRYEHKLFGFFYGANSKCNYAVIKWPCSCVIVIVIVCVMPGDLHDRHCRKIHNSFLCRKMIYDMLLMASSILASIVERGRFSINFMKA